MKNFKLLISSWGCAMVTMLGIHQIAYNIEKFIITAFIICFTGILYLINRE